MPSVKQKTEDPTRVTAGFGVLTESIATLPMPSSPLGTAGEKAKFRFAWGPTGHFTKDLGPKSQHGVKVFAQPLEKLLSGLLSALWKSYMYSLL